MNFLFGRNERQRQSKEEEALASARNGLDGGSFADPSERDMLGTADMKQQIMACGFTDEQATAGLKRKNTVEGAIHWIVSSEGASIIAQHSVSSATGAAPAAERMQLSPLAQQVLQCGMGFTMEQAVNAAKRHSSPESCIEWILAIQSNNGKKPKEDEERECGICFCNEVQTKMVLCECRPAIHWVCRDCLQNWCQAKIDSHEVLSIGCPHGLEGCQTNLTNFVVGSTVDKQHREKYEQLLLEKGWAEGNNRIVHCPVCYYMCELGNDTQRHAVPCQNTRCAIKEFCGLCGYPPHYKEGDPEMNMDCEAFAKWKAQNDGADAAFAKYMKENRVQKCPQCGEACEKAAGCNFMYCKCKTKFCFHCGQKLEESQHFSHFGTYGPYGRGCINRKA